MTWWHLVLDRGSGSASVYPGSGDPKRRWCWGTLDECVEVGLQMAKAVSVYDSPTDRGVGWPRHVYRDNHVLAM